MMFNGDLMVVSWWSNGDLMMFNGDLVVIEWWFKMVQSD